MALEKRLPPESLLPEGRIVLLGLHKHDTPEAMLYDLILVTLEDKKIVYVKPLETCYSDSDAINAATSWIDSNYYDT